jgi:hypothetical protein
MFTGLSCPRCGSDSIKASRKPHKLLSPRLSIRLWQCNECPDKFMVASVIVKDGTAEKLEEIYDKTSPEGIH